MRQKLKRSEIIGCVFTWVMGILLHMLYDWTNQSTIIGLFSPVNESVWEHLKLLFFPILLYSTFQYFYVGREYPNYFTAKLLGIISGISTIIIGFYAILALFGKPITWLDILLFFVAVAVAYVISYRWMTKNENSEAIEILSIFAIMLLVVLFFGFTYSAPDIGLFREISS